MQTQEGMSALSQEIRTVGLRLMLHFGWAGLRCHMAGKFLSDLTAVWLFMCINVASMVFYGRDELVGLAIDVSEQNVRPSITANHICSVSSKPAEVKYNQVTSFSSF
jgi:hypothetical protein